MENQDRDGMTMPPAACDTHADNATRPSQNQRLTSKVPQDYAPGLPLLAWIAGQQKATGSPAMGSGPRLKGEFGRRPEKTPEATTTTTSLNCAENDAHRTASQVSRGGLDG
jgi:hypothetical protein